MQNLPMLTINFTPKGGSIEPLQADLNADYKVDLADPENLSPSTVWLAWISNVSTP